ncbi:MAG: hypothetical protein RLZZ268_299, partial [Cyanobacteriota bacterium]
MYGWYLLGGGYRKIRRWSPPVALCGLYPGLYVLLSLVALGLAWALVGLLGGWMGLPPTLVWILQLGLVSLAGRQAWRLAESLGVVWLFRSIRFTHRLGQARDRDLRQRVASLARQILALEAETP